MPFVELTPWVDAIDPTAGTRAIRALSDDAQRDLVAQVKDRYPVDENPYRYKPGRPRGTGKRMVKAGEQRRVFTLGGDPARLVRVVTEDEKAPFVEYDTPPHIIRATNPTGRLSFRSRSGFTSGGRSYPPGTRVRPEEVRHPGTRGQHPFSLGVHAAHAHLHTTGERALELLKGGLR